MPLIVFGPKGDNDLGKKIEQYKSLFKEMCKDMKVVDKICVLSLEIWGKIAKGVKMELELVEIKSYVDIGTYVEEIKERREYIKYINKCIRQLPLPPQLYVVDFLPQVARSITETKGWAIFVDVVNSTQYFLENESYVGFVIFNSYIMIIKDYIDKCINNADFLAHTGDGAFIFVEDENKERKEEVLDIIVNLLYIAEALKYFAEQMGLIRVIRRNRRHSLVHIGAAWGEGYLAEFIGKQFVSKATWEAATNLKTSPREYDPYNPYITVKFKGNPAVRRSFVLLLYQQNKFLLPVKITF